MPRSESEVVADILVRFDLDGNLREMSDSLEALVGNPFGRFILNLTSVKASAVSELLDRQRSLIISCARSVLLFAPRGWAPCGLTPQSMIESALAIYDRTGDIDRAEVALVKGWNDNPARLRFCETRLRGLGIADDQLAEVCRPRADLVEKALRHHHAGAYEASVPIVLAQVDGLVRDMTDGARGFFSDLKDRSHLRDDRTLAGVDEGLAALQQYFGARQDVSASTGGVSRHGILHGRELGYDSEINSTKCFVLLLAVIEWAQPLAKAIAMRRDAERKSPSGGGTEAGSTGDA